MTDLEELKKKYDRFTFGHLATRDANAIFCLIQVIEVQREGLEKYARHESWDKELYMVYADKDDCEETEWSRFTPGVKARNTLSQADVILKGINNDKKN